MKSTTWLAHGFHSAEVIHWPYHWIWKIDTMPKIQIFLWQMCHKALSVTRLLNARGVNMDAICPLCHQECKLISQLFLICPVVSQVWELAKSHHWILGGIILGVTKVSVT